MKARANIILNDLRHLVLFPRRYRTPQGKTEDYWNRVQRDYCNEQKRIDSSESRWFIILYKDGHEELTRLRVLQGGLLSGYSPAIYRGIFPRLVTFGTYASIKDIYPAF